MLRSNNTDELLTFVIDKNVTAVLPELTYTLAMEVPIDDAVIVIVFS